jgi:hypothetical protein
MAPAHPGFSFSLRCIFSRERILIISYSQIHLISYENMAQPHHLL